MTFTVLSEDELNNVAQNILTTLKQEKISTVCLFGQLGAGKTTLIKKICSQLNITGVINSPTYSIVNEYKTDSDYIYHFDLYRIKNEDELYQIGFEEYLFQDYLCFIEWADQWLNLIPKQYLSVNIICELSKRIISIEHIK